MPSNTLQVFLYCRIRVLHIGHPEQMTAVCNDHVRLLITHCCPQRRHRQEGLGNPLAAEGGDGGVCEGVCCPASFPLPLLASSTDPWKSPGGLSLTWSHLHKTLGNCRIVRETRRRSWNTDTDPQLVKKEKRQGVDPCFVQRERSECGTCSSQQRWRRSFLGVGDMEEKVIVPQFIWVLGGMGDGR